MRTRLVLAVSVVLVSAIGGGAVRLSMPAAPQRWSDPATWNGKLPRAGDTVRVPAGQDIVLDVDPPALAQIVVDGTLRLDDTRDVHLRSGGIAVGGAFVAGSAERPFRHRAEIELATGGSGDGAIAIDDGGRVDLIAPARLAWTKLAATALAGTTQLTLTGAVDWHAGDRVAIAASGFDARECEEATIASVSPSHVVLAAPLHFRHFGAVVDGVDERAEVALLSHDVVVRSDAQSASSGRGGHVMVMRGGRLHVQGVQFTQLGQRGRLGRYPIHFHLAGDETGSYVRASSVEHSFNRCITIHGSRGVELRDDVGFDTYGHCYFLEDGVERGNTVTHDLAMLVRVPPESSRLLASDARPAGFWISNPDNIVSDDVAAGSLGGGFWYDLPEHPTGPSRDSNVWPRRTALGTFERNVSHSNERDGLFVDVLRNPPGVSAAPNYVPPGTGEFGSFTTYKNRRHGVWLRGVHLRVTDARIADNAIGVTFAGADCILRSSIVAGETSNRTEPPKPDEASFPLRGFEFYDGRVGVVSTHFADFVPSAARAASALSALQFSPFFTDPGNFARDLSFERAMPIYLAPVDLPPVPLLGADGYRSTVFRDLDGTVAKALGVRAGPGETSIALDVAFLSAPGCASREPAHVSVCAGEFGALFVNDADRVPTAAGPVLVRRMDGPAAKIALRGNPSDRVSTGFQTNVRPGARYRVWFGGAAPRRARLSLHAVGPEASVAVEVPQEGIACLELHGGDVVDVGLGQELPSPASPQAACRTQQSPSRDAGRPKSRGSSGFPA